MQSKKQQNERQKNKNMALLIINSIDSILLFSESIFELIFGK